MSSYQFTIEIDNAPAGSTVSITIDPSTGSWSIGDQQSGLKLAGVSQSSVDLGSFRVTHNTITVQLGSSQSTPTIDITAAAVSGTTKLSGFGAIPTGCTVRLGANGQQQSLDPSDSNWTISV